MFENNTPVDLLINTTAKNPHLKEALRPFASLKDLRNRTSHLKWKITH